MDSASQEADASAPLPSDELTQLQLKVAQRADQISQKNGGARERDKEYWLEAEREFLPPVK
jgi:hypothetical protein